MMSYKMDLCIYTKLLCLVWYMPPLRTQNIKHNYKNLYYICNQLSLSDEKVIEDFPTHRM